MGNSLYKGTLKNIILQLLKNDGRMYGYQMTQEARLLTNGELEITEGALYPLLHNLESDGLITSDTRIVNGRARKYYFLSEKGKEKQVAYETEMKSYLSNLKAIFNL